MTVHNTIIVLDISFIVICNGRSVLGIFFATCNERIPIHYGIQELTLLPCK